MPKPTISDIGKAAGVSLATVDRVLNARPGVRQSTIDRVNAAIQEIGYVRDVAAANLARKRQYRFLFILPKSHSAFLASVRDAVESVADTPLADRSDVEIMEVPPEDPHRLVLALRELDDSQVDGIAILADETPQLRDEITRLKTRGVRVVSIISDLPSTSRDYFIGIDGVAAGETAGVLMGRFVGQRQGAIVTLTSSMRSRESVERRFGFDKVINSRFSNLVTLPTIEIHDDPELARGILARVLERRDDVVGLYSFGTGHSGALDALRERPDSESIVGIAHDLTGGLADALRQGVLDAVISQNVDHIVRSAVRVLRAKCDRQVIVESQERVRIEIVLPENLPGERVQRSR